MSVVFPLNPDPRFRLSTAVGVETSFSVPFPFQDNADISLVKYLVDGTEIPLTEGVDYSLTGAGSPSGGTATLVVPLVAGQKMLRVGRAVLDRVTSIVRSGRFKSQAIDDDIDRWIIIAQELSRDTARGWKSPFGSAGGVIHAGPAGTTALFDQRGNLVQGPDGGAIANAQQYAAIAQQSGLSAENAAVRAEAAADAAESVIIGNEFPVSYQPQPLSPEQQAQARANIGVGAITDPYTWEYLR